MTDQIIYATFPDKEQATSLLALLIKANIDHEVEETSSLFTALASEQPIFDRIKIKIKASDAERVDALIEQDNETASVEHFLFTFSDEDLIDIIKDPTDWLQEEVEIAQKIIKSRGLDPTFKPSGLNTVTTNTIGTIPVQPLNTTNPQKKTKKIRSRPIDIVLVIAVVSLINTILDLIIGSSYYSFIVELLHIIIGSKASSAIQLLTTPSLVIIGFKYGTIHKLIYSLFFFVLYYFCKKENILAIVISLFIFMIDIILWTSAGEFIIAFFYLAFFVGIVNELISPKRRKTKKRVAKHLINSPTTPS
jgi:hypothetical protein